MESVREGKAIYYRLFALHRLFVHGQSRRPLEDERRFGRRRGGQRVDRRDIHLGGRDRSTGEDAEELLETSFLRRHRRRSTESGVRGVLSDIWRGKIEKAISTGVGEGLVHGTVRVHRRRRVEDRRRAQSLSEFLQLVVFQPLTLFDHPRAKARRADGHVDRVEEQSEEVVAKRMIVLQNATRRIDDRREIVSMPNTDLRHPPFIADETQTPGSYFEIEFLVDLQRSNGDVHLRDLAGDHFRQELRVALLEDHADERVAHQTLAFDALPVGFQRGNHRSHVEHHLVIAVLSVVGVFAVQVFSDIEVTAKAREALQANPIGQ